MTTVELWLNGEHYVFDREQWEALVDSVDGPVHDLDDDELQDRIDQALATESAA
jgi:hypothetical protein